MKATPETKPPRLAIKLLNWWSNNSSVEDLHGDIEELFYQDLETMSSTRAKVKYWQYTLSLILSYTLKKRKQISAFPPLSYNPITLVMIKNYFTIAWRMIQKNKSYSIINVLGLSLGICACLTIYAITMHEFSFDRFHPDKDRIYRLVIENVNKNGEKWMAAGIQAPAPMVLREGISGFEAVTAFHYYDPKATIPEKGKTARQFERTRDRTIIADPEYFSVFQYTWLAGNTTTLREPFKVVLSESKARTYFGTEPWDQILGREIIYDDSIHASVSGIVKDWTGHTDFPHNEFISFATIPHSPLKELIKLDRWGGLMHSSQGFVKLQPGRSPNELSKQATALFKKSRTVDEWGNMELKFQPLTEIHFNSNYVEFPSLLPTLYGMMGLAFFILLIAAINFINLSTAQSLQRSKEIGIRKVLGSLRTSLMIQFLVETLVLTTFAVGLAVLLVNPVLTLFDSFIPQGVTFDPFSTPSMIFFLAVTLATALLAGFYPAIVVSAHRPSVNAKGAGTHKGSEKWILRKALIVFQFAMCLFFIIGTLVIGNQIRFIRTKDRGFNTESIVTLRTDKGKFNGSKTKAFAQQVKALTGVASVTVQSAPPMGFAQIINIIVYRGKTDIEVPVSLKDVDNEYLSLYQIPLLAGRNIVESDSLREFVINEAYLKVLGFIRPEDAVGQFLIMNGKPYPIAGVVKDFHERSFRAPIGPSAMAHFSKFQMGLGVKLLPLAPSERDHVLAQIETLYKKIYPDEPFEIHFIEDEIAWMHDGEKKTAKLMNVAMLVTIFISCLGVFGLAMFTARTKTKEIGIRKVLGASVTGIVTMLSKEFIVLIAIAIAVASPVSWYYTNNWLQGFAYRVDVTIWIYVLAGLAALSIGLISMSFQTVKAALANPADSLRTE